MTETFKPEAGVCETWLQRRQCNLLDALVTKMSGVNEPEIAHHRQHPRRNPIRKSTPVRPDGMEKQPSYLSR